MDPPSVGRFHVLQEGLVVVFGVGDPGDVPVTHPFEAPVLVVEVKVQEDLRGGMRPPRVATEEEPVATVGQDEGDEVVRRRVLVLGRRGLDVDVLAARPGLLLG
ncbi:hypothetical protein ACUXK4_004535 [Methylorubrum extorquens]